MRRRDEEQEQLVENNTKLRNKSKTLKQQVSQFERQGEDQQTTLAAYDQENRSLREELLFARELLR